MSSKKKHASHFKGQSPSHTCPSPSKKIPTESTHMIIIKHHDEILLVKRPQSGIWGGLWSLPQHENTSITPKTWIKKHLGLEASLLKRFKSLNDVYAFQT